MSAHFPYWLTPAAAPTPSTPLSPQLHVDVAIVGAGIAGMTAALLLKEAGCSVAVFEMNQLGQGETGHTTAHVTEILDARYHQLEKDFGVEGSRRVAQSVAWANAEIRRIVEDRQISCDYENVPAFLYSDRESGREQEFDLLKQEVEAARRAGLDASLTVDVPLPFTVRAALRLNHQAQFHPYRYLLALGKSFAGPGASLFEHARVMDVKEGEPCEVVTDRGSVTAKDVLVLANAPFLNRLLLQTKIASYRTYAVAYTSGGAGATLPPAGLYWDTADPYHYIRTHPTPKGSLLIVGGEDHKTGQEKDTEGAYRGLQAYAAAHFQTGEVASSWSGQIIETVDGLPFIGCNSANRHVYVGTGFSGNGMTFGTLSALILSDLVLGKANAYADLYQATRVKPLAQAQEYLKENVDFPLHLIEDRLSKAEVTTLSAIPPGEGKTLQWGLRKVAVFRDSQGICHPLSPVCTHLGCIVQWNTAEKSWDCPCHGARFDPRGKVINGPATKDLSPVNLKEL